MHSSCVCIQCELVTSCALKLPQASASGSIKALGCAPLHLLCD